MAATVAPAGHICVLRSNGDDGNRIPLDASAAATVTFGRALTSDVRIALAHCSRGTAAGLPVRFDFSRDAPCRVSAGPGGRVYAHPRSTARLRVEEGMEVSVSRSLAL